MNVMPDVSSSTGTGSPAPARAKGGLLFLALVLLEAVILLTLLGTHRMVRGHDGLQYFTLQYWFLNSVATTGEISQWMPFMTHGTVGNWWHTSQASMVQSALVLAGTLLKGANFLPFFYAGIFFDEMVLLAGMWLLSGRYFTSSQTRFFVAAAAMGSCIWMDQPWFNFHFYYALPLLLHLLHGFLDSGRWRYVLLAGNLLALQTMGSLPYMIPVTTLVICVYFAAWISLVDRSAWRERRFLKHPIRGILCLVPIGLVFAMVYVLLKHGTAELAVYNYGRGQDEKTSLVGFLTYAGTADYTMWLETVLGVSPSMDYTLYFGIFSIVFVVLGAVYGRDRRAGVLWCVTALLFLFSFGGFVAYACHRLWPVMSFYRHVMMVCVLMKPFLCLLAGFGFEACVLRRVNRAWPMLLAAIALGALAAWLLNLATHPKVWAELLKHIPPHGTLSIKKFMDPSVTANSLVLSSAWALIAGMLLVLLTLNIREKARAMIAALVLVMQVMNLYAYKTLQTISKTFPMDKFQCQVNDFQPIPWHERRQPDTVRNPRTGIFFKELLATRYGVYNWTLGSYLFSDSVGSVYRADHWLIPLDDFMRAFWKQPQRDFRVHPSGLQTLRRLEFPTNHVACVKFSGLGEDKIQFFRSAIECGDDRLIASCITSPDFRGDLLFLSDTRPAPNVATPPQLGSSDRVPSHYKVLRFDANHLDVEADAGGGAWMFYSDVWHPFWRAVVNGEEVEVRRANMAYKAVPIGPGKNIVQFTFGSPLASAIFIFLALNSLLWIAFVLFLLLRCGGIIRSHVTQAEGAGMPPPLWTSAIRQRALVGSSVLVAAFVGMLVGSARLRNELFLVAAGGGHIRLAGALLAIGSDINARDSQGATPIYFAASRGQGGMVRELLWRGANADTPCDDGTTPLLKAAVEDHLDTACSLINAGAGVNTAASEGSTPLLYAAWNDNTELVRLLLTRSPDVNLANRGGRTPLMCAAWQGNLEIVRMLLARGADRSLKDENGWTALKCAEDRGFKEVAEALKCPPGL